MEGVLEILSAITIFRLDFSVPFLAMVITLLFIKSLHWLGHKRLEYMVTTPTVTTLAHVRIVSFFGLLLLMDALFLYNAVKTLSSVRHPSVLLFFAFEYMILATTVAKGNFHLLLGTYTVFASLVLVSLLLLCDLCVRVADYIRYRIITSNMNDRFPDATPEKLNANDTTCIICREEMVTAKKLICGRLFHLHSLRSWLERQHTCPTCRALVVPSEDGSATGGRHGIRSVSQHQVEAVALGFHLD